MNWITQFSRGLARSLTPVGIGPGRLVLVVGPSGAGKDTLIARARAMCRDDQVVFPRRVVTRPASAAEDNDTLSHEAFDAALAGGAFALAWNAHGLKYGIPGSIVTDIRADRTVVCNVSRTVVAAARARYAHVTVVLITAPPEVLAARLKQRARPSDGAIEERVRRRVDDPLVPDVFIDTVGPIEANARRLLDVVLGRIVVAL
jgi:ribose 1,5-bisphosphokinase